jgi:hypothetical protein
MRHRPAEARHREGHPLHQPGRRNGDCKRDRDAGYVWCERVTILNSACLLVEGPIQNVDNVIYACDS